MIEENNETAVLTEKFDMFREITTNMMRDAVGFAYIEHLFRISTNINTCAAEINKMKGEIKNKLLAIASSRNHVLQACIHELDNTIFSEDILELEPNMMSIDHKWNGQRLAIAEIQYGVGENLPVCYTLFFKGKYFLLYTPNMTFLDGYDPFSGETKIPLLTQAMITNFSKNFYRRACTKEVQTDNNKQQKKKVKVVAEKKSTSSSVVGTDDIGIFNDNTNDEITKEPFDPILEQNEEQKIEEEEEEDEEVDEEVDDIYENSDKDETFNEESEDNQYEFVPPKQPGERTWERFQRKANEKQKERDQCGPGDCYIS